ncbi:MAG TPA: hypothetical protein PKV27_09995, partial [Ilumatobacteraceae bacterium]|nr:hypothetical protein [Ilumatobacteraceae bacterium]
AGVAAGMVVAGDRQAGAQGVLGGMQTLVAGLSAPLIGSIYQHHGRTVAYTAAAAMMVALIIAGLWLARPAWGIRGTTTPNEV